MKTTTKRAARIETALEQLQKRVNAVIEAMDGSHSDVANSRMTHREGMSEMMDIRNVLATALAASNS